MIKLWEEKDKYKIAVLQPKLTTWVEGAVQSFSHSGSKEQASRTLQLECTKVDGKTDFPVGSVVIIYSAATNKEIIRYTITKKNKQRKSTSIKYTARDIRWWLTRSKIDKKYENMTGSDIFRDLCNSLGIPIGQVANTGEKFNVLHFIKKTPWDILITALTETRKRSGEKFVTKVEQGKLSLVKKTEQAKKWVIEEGVNLIDATYEESMEKMYTQVKVEGKDDNGKSLTAVKSAASMQEKYGIMQEYITQSDKITQSELNKIAAQQLKELAQLQKSGTVVTFGIDGVYSGDAVYVIDKETGLVGGFYVESDEHKYSKGYHEMKLKLAWTDELPSIKYEAPK